MMLALIVEGEGDLGALPILVRAVALAHGRGYVDIPPGFRLRRDRFRKPGEYERALRLMAAKVAPDGPILTVLDADDDCPATLGPELLEIAKETCPKRRVGVVAAKREFEAWLLASARSLAGARGLPAELEPPPDPEEVRGEGVAPQPNAAWLSADGGPGSADGEAVARRGARRSVVPEAGARRVPPPAARCPPAVGWAFRVSRRRAPQPQTRFRPPRFAT